MQKLFVFYAGEMSKSNRYLNEHNKRSRQIFFLKIYIDKSFWCWLSDKYIIFIFMTIANEKRS